MRLTELTDITLRALMCLQASGERYVQAREISRRLGLPAPQLSRATQILRSAGYIVSRRGRLGGIALARSGDEISVREIVELIEGGLDLVKCFRTGGSGCPLEGRCTLACELMKAREKFLAHLGAVSIEDLARDLDDHPPRAPLAAAPAMA